MRLSKKAKLICLFLFSALFCADIASKKWVYEKVFSSIEVFKSFLGVDLFIEYVTNKGGAWGVFADYGTFLFGFRIIIVIALSLYLAFFCRQQKTALFTTLIITGAIGNIFDFYYYGFVIDMIHFTFWGHSYGVFNLADLFIFIGSIGLVIAFQTTDSKIPLKKKVSVKNTIKPSSKKKKKRMT